MTHNPIRLIREVQAMRRARRATALTVIAFTVVIVGMLLMTTDWFGTGILLAIGGFAAACIADEMVR